MTEWAALTAAAQRLYVGATQESLIASSAESGTDDMRRASGMLVRLRARLHDARAASRVRETQPASSGSSYEQTIEDKLLTQKILEYMAQEDAVMKLFRNTNLTAEEAQLKQETMENMQRLTEVEGMLEQLHKTSVEKQTQLTALNKKWDHIVKELIEQKAKFERETDTEESSQNPEKLQLETMVTKMELIRKLLSRFLAAPLGYSYIDDKDNLMSLLPLTRQPFTMESVLKEIS